MIAPLLAAELPPGERRADNLVIIQVHLLLAIIVLARYLAEFDDAASAALRPLFLAFACYSVTVFLACRRSMRPATERALLLAEALWLSAMVFATGGSNSVFFPFYIFSIMIAAFRFGRADGVRLAVAASLLYIIAAAAEQRHFDPVRVIMRVGFLLTLGAFIASLGEANLKKHRRLALLRDINGFANPRFGIDRTVADVMERCRLHFGAATCLLVLRRGQSQRYELRVAGTGQGSPQRLPATAPLARLAAQGVLLFTGTPANSMLRRLGPLSRAWTSARLLLREADGQWRSSASAAAEDVADLCDARSFISVPLAFRGGSARITLCAAGHYFDADDAAFLEQIVAQVLPAIENVYLLDRMASLAAVRERRIIAHDLHDSAIQPYIGLNASLAALRRKVSSENPLRPDIDELAAMSAQVIEDLRQFAGNFSHGGKADCALIDAPLRRQLLRAKQWYDVDIALELQGAAGMGDRLSAAVLQLSHEGISNICKHTSARRASLRIRCDAQLLRLDIENDSEHDVPHFIPRSITARASALGGYAAVEHRRGATLVRVAIPV